MSRIYFHSLDGEDAELRGSERAYGAGIAHSLFLDALGLDRGILFDEELKRWRRVLPAGHYTSRTDNARDIATWLQVSAETLPMGDAGDVEVFAMTLQTAIDAGGDAVKLLARLHGQCELHAYVEGANRAWLAAIIARGRETGVLRPDQGWEAVRALLLRADDSPVVTSYSVCDQFPSRYLVDEPRYEEDSDAWYELPFPVRWGRCMDALRAERPTVEMRPEGWDDYRFGAGVNGYAYRRYLDTLEMEASAA